MAIVAAKNEQVKSQPGVRSERSHPMVVQLAWNRTLVVSSSTRVDYRLHECIVHRYDAVAEARACFRQDGRQCRSRRDRDIFHDVMLEVAFRFDSDVQARISGERG